MSAELDFTKVNFGQMELAQSDMISILGSFERATDDLITKLKQELAGHWEGPGGAEEYFRQHEEKWNVAAANMRLHLNELQGDGPPVADTVFTYHVTGTSNPQGVPSNFQWEIKFSFSVKSTETVEVPNF